MISLPKITQSDGITKKVTTSFDGIHQIKGAVNGAIYTERNMTSNDSPYLSTRNPRYMIYDVGDYQQNAPYTLYAYDGYCYFTTEDELRRVKKTTGAEESLFQFQDLTIDATTRKMAVLGDYLVVFPDKIYYNMSDGTYGDIGSSTSITGVTFGDESTSVSTTSNSVKPTGLAHYAWGTYFNVGDAVTITDSSDNDGTYIIRKITSTSLIFYDNTFTNDTDAGEVTFARTVPDLDVIFSHDNRLWGAKDNVIYCSKLGDIFNWNVYDGLNDDSWTVETSTTDAFTGGIAFRGYPTFFKDNMIIKVYGSLPSNFQLSEAECLGVAEGSAKSLAIVDNTLFYLSRGGVMAYTSSSPQPIGARLGNYHFKYGTGGSGQLKYYISMADENNTWKTYVYDTQRYQWDVEELEYVNGYSYSDGCTYMSNDYGLWVLSDSDTNGCSWITSSVTESGMESYVIFQDFFESQSNAIRQSPNMKGIAKIQLRIGIEEDAQVVIQMSYYDGAYETVTTLTGTGLKKSHYLPIIPRRCDHYAIKISSTGGNAGAWTLYSLVREVYIGSELY